MESNPRQAFVDDQQLEATMALYSSHLPIPGIVSNLRSTNDVDNQFINKVRISSLVALSAARLSRTDISDKDRPVVQTERISRVSSAANGPYCIQSFSHINKNKEN